MVTLRSHRLETIFGGRLDAIGHAEVAALVTIAATEDYDLDFKSALYGRSDPDKRELAGDVAAMANAAGGVIVLGIAEDDHARAASAPGVPLSDAEEGRIRQIMASNVFPLPSFDPRSIHDPERPGHGFILITVPRSPSSPHAVLVNNNLRFPKRHGRTTTYLSESEVAEAYRARFARIENSFDELARYESDLARKLDANLIHAVVTLTPDLAGDFRIDAETVRAFEREMLGRSPLILDRKRTWQRVGTGRRRLTADASLERPFSRTAARLACELHQSGAGSFAAQVGKRQPTGEANTIVDQEVINAILSGLRFLARHARDRAATGGTASLRATLWRVAGSFPVRLVGLYEEDIEEQALPVVRAPVSTGVFDVEDLSDDGPALVSAAYRLASGLFQELGRPEALHLTRDGSIRVGMWQSNDRAPLSRWAEAAGVQTVPSR